MGEGGLGGGAHEEGGVVGRNGVAHGGCGGGCGRGDINGAVGGTRRN